MNATIRIFAALLFALGFVGCSSLAEKTSSNEVAPGTQMIPKAIPTPIRNMEVYDPVLKKRVEVDVLSLKSGEIRRRLTSTETIVSVEKHDSSGKLVYLGAGGRYSKGSYRVTFDSLHYTNQEISFGGEKQKRAIGQIGVGLRITAELQTLENNVDLGDLIPIGIAAQKSSVTGSLGLRVFGMSNDRLGLAVPTTLGLDSKSIQRAFEAAAAVRVIFGMEETQLEPYLLGVAGVEPTDAPRAFDAAKVMLAGDQSASLLGAQDFEATVFYRLRPEARTYRSWYVASWTLLGDGKDSLFSGGTQRVELTEVRPEWIKAGTATFGPYEELTLTLDSAAMVDDRNYGTIDKGGTEGKAVTVYSPVIIRRRDVAAKWEERANHDGNGTSAGDTVELTYERVERFQPSGSGADHPDVFLDLKVIIALRSEPTPRGEQLK